VAAQKPFEKSRKTERNRDELMISAKPAVGYLSPLIQPLMPVP
jgi:hypothetical protein